MNCGDWVESCTALVEHADGRFEIIHWADHEGTARPLPDDEDQDELPFGRNTDRKTEIAA
jgi:hypothetical protein